MSYDEAAFVDLLLKTLHEIRAGEWLYSKNEARLCRILNDNPDARAELRAVHDALAKIVD